MCQLAGVDLSFDFLAKKTLRKKFTLNENNISVYLFEFYRRILFSTLTHQHIGYLAHGNIPLSSYLRENPPRCIPFFFKRIPSCDISF